MIRGCCYDRNLCIFFNCPKHTKIKPETVELSKGPRSDSIKLPKQNDFNDTLTTLFDVRCSKEVFTCPFCQRIFIHKLPFARHVKIHTFTCKSCNRGNFKTKTGLAFHEKKCIGHECLKKRLTVTLHDVALSRNHKEIYEKALYVYSLKTDQIKTEIVEDHVQFENSLAVDSVKLEAIDFEIDRNFLNSNLESCISIKIEDESSVYYDAQEFHRSVDSSQHPGLKNNEKQSNDVMCDAMHSVNGSEKFDIFEKHREVSTADTVKYVHYSTEPNLDLFIP